MKLKETLGVPAGHELKQTNFRQKGTMAQNEYWEYDQIDEQSNLVARIKRWECTSLSLLSTDAGYTKHSPTGELIEEVRL
jgi:hypothetical protein